MEQTITLYDMARQMVANEEKLDVIALNKKLLEISKEMILIEDTKYFFLICPDLRQYVMMHINQNSTFESVSKELLEIFCNRGDVLLIDPAAENVWEFWIKDKYDENIYMYQLTPYEVLEV